RSAAGGAERGRRGGRRDRDHLSGPAGDRPARPDRRVSVRAALIRPAPSLPAAEERGGRIGRTPAQVRGFAEPDAALPALSAASRPVRAGHGRAGPAGWTGDEPGRVAVALLFLSPDDPAEAWRAELQARMPELDVRIWPKVGDPAQIDVALVWRPPPGELARYPNLRAILSLGAGIDGLIADPDLPDVPIARMVDPSLTRTMTEYVLLAVLRHHREFDRFERAQRAREGAYAFPRQASERRVGVMGLGELGGAAARQLVAHGFQVLGWSRTPKALDGVVSYAGRSELHNFLHRTDILVCMLPLTA